MKYFSDVTKLMYNSIEEAEKAEKEFLNKKETEKAEKEAAIDFLRDKSEECDAARKACDEASAKYSKTFKELTNAVNRFYKLYGYVPKEYQSLNFFSSFWL